MIQPKSLLCVIVGNSTLKRFGFGWSLYFLKISFRIFSGDLTWTRYWAAVMLHGIKKLRFSTLLQITVTGVTGDNGVVAIEAVTLPGNVEHDIVNIRMV